MRLSTLALTPITLAIALSLSACGGGSDDDSQTPLPTETSASAPAPTETPASDSTPNEQTTNQTPDTPSDNTIASDTPPTIPTISPQEAKEVSELLGKDSRTSSYIITLNSSSQQTPSQAAQAASTTLIKALNTNLVSTEHTFSSALSGFQISVPSSLSPQALSSLLSNPDILSIEPVRLTHTETTPTTTTRRTLDIWGLDRIDQQNLPLSYSFSSSLTGRGSNVYVIDTGILATHNELLGRVGTGANFTSLSGTSDCDGHGTHVASTIAGITTGVAPEATVYPLRALNCSGTGTTSAIIQSLDWIYNNGKLPGTINLSIGTPTSPAVNAAIAKLYNKGFVIAAAAGNSNTDACSQSPASAPEALTVAASTPNDSRASFSNFGQCVDIFAPGAAIKGASISSTSAFSFKSGTSMASPHVAGVSALLQQANPSYSPTQISQLILSSSTPNKITDPKNSPNFLLYSSPNPSPISTPTPISTPISTPTPVNPKTINISLSSTQKLHTKPYWLASTTLTVLDGLQKPLPKVLISGSFSAGGITASCTTNTSGSCTITTQAIPDTTPSTTFTVKTALLAGYSMASPPPSSSTSPTPLSISTTAPTRPSVIPSNFSSNPLWTSKTTWNANSSFYFYSSDTNTPTPSVVATFANSNNPKQLFSCVSDKTGKCSLPLSISSSSTSLTIKLTTITNPTFNAPASLPSFTITQPTQPSASAVSPSISFPPTAASATSWYANITTTISDNNNQPLPGATLTYKSTDGKVSTSCTSTSTGLCTARVTLTTARPSLTLTQISLTHPINTPSLNTSPILVKRP